MIARRDFLTFAIAGAAIPSCFRMGAWVSSASSDDVIADVHVNWKSVVAQTTAFTFGSNDYEVLNPRKGGDLAYHKRLKKLNLGLIRIHHAGLSDRWSDAATQTWDVAKIKASFAAASYLKGVTLIQNIPNWPKWMQRTADGLLDPSEHQRYAQFCADLVKILNRDLQLRVAYWEPLNEREVIYRKAGRLNELWQLYNRCAIAMKRADPSIKVGGPVMTWDNMTVLRSFLKDCGPHVDFISWHRYGSGNAKESTDTLMAYTPRYADQVKTIRNITTQIIPTRNIPLLLGEYNVNFSWKSGENRQNTQIGAAWFASVLKHLAESGIDMATSWHLKDGIYGLIDPHNTLRPAATVFEWGIQYLIGTVVQANCNHSAVEAFAVRQRTGDCTLLLINKSNQSVTVGLQSAQSKPDFAKGISVLYLADDLTNNGKPQPLRSRQVRLTPYALALLRFPAQHSFVQ
jgi:hypothetical protein